MFIRDSAQTGIHIKTDLRQIFFGHGLTVVAVGLLIEFVASDVVGLTLGDGGGEGGVLVGGVEGRRREVNLLERKELHFESDLGRDFIDTGVNIRLKGDNLEVHSRIPESICLLSLHLYMALL